MQTASFLALGNVLSAQAQVNPPMGQTPPEQVLVTGSLIHGAAAVGVPEIVPVEVLNVSPAGSVPLLKAHVYGAVPPVAVSAWL